MTRSRGLIMKVAEAPRILFETPAMVGLVVLICVTVTQTGCRTPLTSSGSPAFASGDRHEASLAWSEIDRLPPVASNNTPVADHRLDGNLPVQLTSWETTSPPNANIPLTLTDAISLALERNPDLAAARAAEPVAQAAFHTAETYPWNPQFQTQVLPYSRDRNGNDGAISQQHVIVQTFELGGQRGFRVGAAAASWEQVNSTIGQAELLNMAQTGRLFFAALYQRERRDMSQTLADLNEQLVGIIERREEAGQANKADVELARLQSQSSRRQQRLAEASYQTALTNLRNQLNLDSSAPLNLPGNWIDWEWRTLGETLGTEDGEAQHFAGDLGGGPDDEFLRNLAANRPDVMAARAAANAAIQNLQLANAMRRPNLQVGPMYQRDDSSTEFWGIQGQINIPVVNSGMTLVRQRTAEQQQQQVTAASLETRAVLESRAAIQRYERARRLVTQSRGGFDRSISDALKPFEDQFKAGQITLLQVFAARAVLIQSRQSFLDLINETALAAADVTQATGLPPQQLIVDAEPLPAPLEEVPTP